MNEPTAGELRTPIKIFDWIESPDEAVSLDSDYSRVRRVWAKVEVVSSAMYWGSSQIDERVTHRVWVRCVPHQTDSRSLERSRVIIEGRLYAIKRVSDFEERHVWTIIEVEELEDVSGS